MTAGIRAVHSSRADEDRDGLPQWLLTTDHKRIGLLTIGTALILFFFNGAIALTVRARLAQPNQDILSPQAYLQFMTMHGTGTIGVTTPLALGLGVTRAAADRRAADRGAAGHPARLLALRGRRPYADLESPDPGRGRRRLWGYLPLSSTI